MLVIIRSTQHRNDCHNDQDDCDNGPGQSAGESISAIAHLEVELIGQR